LSLDDRSTTPAARIIGVATNPIDDYLDGVDEPKRSTLEALRHTLRELIPDAQECLAYGVPAMRHDGKLVAGFAAYRNHLTYLPHSGSVLATLTEQTAGYETSKGALTFPVDTPLPRPLVEALVAARLAEISHDSPH
jgi:uncharacterized protein YdhG (YjbR/CyaY superfamily)